MAIELSITGLGCISAIGNNVSAQLASLLSGRSGIAAIAELSTVHRNDFPLGEVKLSNAAMADLLSLTAQQRKQFTRTALLGAIAAKEALEAAKIDLNDGQRTAFVSSTTVGGMDKTENIVYQDENDTSFVCSHLCGASTVSIANYLGIMDYTATLSTACSSGANAIMHAARLIRHGKVDRAVVGGVDALSKFTLNGFNSLQILDKDWCKPFDKERKGLNLGEGAGFIVLEKRTDERKAQHICRLIAYANANDAFHQTASSPDGVGAYMAMKGALEMAGIAPSEVDYINAHGTGTGSNDITESVAIERIFGAHIPPYSSTKPFTGHTLGASAGVEAVFSVLAIQHNLIYPSLNISQAMPELKQPPNEVLQKDVKVNTVLSNSFGFGGNSSSLLFSI